KHLVDHWTDDSHLEKLADLCELAAVAAFADGKRLRYLNINAQLTDASGNLLDGTTVDGLHLSVKGYQVWADALKPIFTQLLGPPAKEDHAPPVTGDPSAR